MPITFEGFLNFIIPIAVLFFIAAAVWWKMREPIAAFFKWLANLFGTTKDKVMDAAKSGPTEITYG